MQSDCVWVKRCRETETSNLSGASPVSLSGAQASISQVRASGQCWHYPSLRLSLCCCKKISWLWPGTFLSHRDWCGLASSPACLFSQSVYACLGWKSRARQCLINLLPTWPRSRKHRFSLVERKQDGAHLVGGWTTRHGSSPQSGADRDPVNI